MAVLFLWFSLCWITLRKTFALWLFTAWLLCCPAILCSAAAAPLAGTLIITGSDTMATLVANWADTFMMLHPGVQIEIQAPGSGSAPPALAAGTANLGSMSRPMTAAEVERFTAERGYAPVGLPVGIDTIALIVHPSNPLDAIALETVDAIFSRTRSCGAAAPIERWSAALPDAEFAPQWIERYGRTSVSGTHGFFKQTALCGGDFSPRVNALPGSAAVIDAVAANPAAIGYTGLGFVNARVKVLAIDTLDGAFLANSEATLARDYPLARVLYMYLAGSPDYGLSGIECAFLRFIRSDEGMRLQRASGFIPMPKSDSAIEVQLADVCQ